MTPQDAPAGPVLGEKARRAVEVALWGPQNFDTRNATAVARAAVDALEPIVASLLSSAREEGEPRPGDLYAWPEPPLGTVLVDRDSEQWERLEGGWRCTEWPEEDPTRSPWQVGDGYGGEPVTLYAPLHVVRWGSS
jgi:hypothetical protein